MQLDPERARVRAAVLRHFVERGEAATVDELADETGLPVLAVRAGLGRLADAHVVALQPGTDLIRMAMPFSGVPTDFRVTAARRDGTAGAWWANCAWDALGMAAALAGAGLAAGSGPVRIATTCPDCERTLGLVVRTDAPSTDAVRVEGSEPGDGSAVVHFAVAASHWWDDIGFT